MAKRDRQFSFFVKFFWNGRLTYRTDVRIITAQSEIKMSLGVIQVSAQYLVIDQKSYYATVECVARGLDPMKTNLVVADPDRSQNTICYL